MKIYQKIQKLNLPLAIPLLLASLLFVISSCSSAAAIVDVVTPSTGVTLVTPCPANIDMMTPPAETTVAVMWTPPTATDSNGTSLTAAASRNPGDDFPLEATTVTYTFTDDASPSNTETCSFTVTVLPASTGVTVSDCPTGPIVEEIVGAGVTLPVTWTEPTAKDSNGNTVAIASQSHSPGDDFTVGTTVTVIYTFTDTAGNDGTCSFTVTVNPDPNAPMITDCPADIDMMTAVAETTVAVTWTPPTAKDSDGMTLTTMPSHSPGDDFPLGGTVVTYTFTDTVGLSNTCSFMVTVSQPPSTGVIISDCPAGITELTVPAGQSAVVTWTPPTASDSNNNPVAIATQTHSPGDSFFLGTTIVVYTFTDDAGNDGGCIFPVTVLQPQSTGVIISDCPADIMRSATGTMTVVTWTETATATDTNGMGAQLTKRSHKPGSAFPLGDTEVIYTFEDFIPNEGTCTFTVTVLPVSTGVTITFCPADITLVASVIATWMPPTATDSNDLPILSTGISSTHSSGDLFPVGETEVIYTFTDGGSNIDNSCTFTVTVPASTGVTITFCPNADGIMKPLPIGMDTVAVSWDLPRAVDSNDLPILSTGISSTHSSGDLFPVGETEVIYTFEDFNGNEGTCTFTVTVLPTSTGVTITFCPDDITQALGAGTTVPVIWMEPTAEDSNGDVAVLTTRSASPGDQLPAGVVMVNYLFRDASTPANMATCTFTVTITQ